MLNACSWLLAQAQAQEARLVLFVCPATDITHWQEDGGD